MLALLKNTIRNRIPFGRISYSQEGEDMVLARLFEGLGHTGFYVDIGAHHPVRFSNTFYFYRRGWHGVNVDALPGTAKLFQRMRPRDKTIECGVGVEQGVMTYFAFNEPALNTFLEVEAIKKNHAPYHLINKTEMPIKTLAQILDSCIPNGTQIDFLTVDVEGLDYEVIASNDWERYRPTILLVELLNTSIDDLSGNMTAQLLQQQGYRVFSRTYNTFFFIKQDAVI